MHNELVKNYLLNNNLYDINIEKLLFKADRAKLLELKNLFSLTKDELICLNNKTYILTLLKLDINQIKYLIVCLKNTNVLRWLNYNANILSFFGLDFTNMQVLANLINDFANTHFEDETLVKEFLTLDIIQIYYFIQQAKQLDKKDLTNPFILADILKKIK